MTLKILLLYAAVCCSGVALAQSELPAFGHIRQEDISLKECAFDKEAEAVIIFDDAFTDYDQDYSMVTKRRVRLKILNEKGLDRANISIPYYSHDNFEYIHNLEAGTYNVDASGNIVYTPLEIKSVYKEKKNKYWSYMKFAMPAVRAGSIIEYRYESRMKHYGGLESWEFQSDLPTMKSSYLLQVLPDAEFAYSVQKRPLYSIYVKPIASEGRIYFEMNNIPALRFEPYMDAPRDYLQRVIFQLSGIVTRYGNKMDINTSWKTAAIDLSTDKNFGGQLNKEIKSEELDKLVENMAGETGKMRTVYDFVRRNIAWNGVDAKYAEGSLKSTWEKRNGNSGEINLLLINLLRKYEIEAVPMLVAERDFGRVDTTYPYLDRFNKVVALVTADNKRYILDGTQTYSPAGLTPYPLLNTVGFLVDRKAPGIVRIGSGGKSYRNHISINMTLEKTGVIIGEAEIKSFEYAMQLSMAKMKENKNGFAEEYFETPHENMEVDSFLVQEAENDTSYLIQKIAFKQQLNESGGFIFINHNLFTGLQKNPFTSSVRFTNVNFGYPYNIILEEKIQLPAGSKIESVPKDRVLENKNRSIGLSRQIKEENGQVSVVLSFRQTVTLVEADQYGELKEFYRQLHEMLNEPILVKLSGQ